MGFYMRNERNRARFAEEALEGGENSLIFGRNAVMELIRSGRSVDKIFIATGEREGSITVIAAEAKARGIPVVDIDRKKLDRMANGLNHQGVCASAAEKEYVTIEEILGIAAERGEPPFVVVADGVEDPHNLGAIIRCAEGAGAHGIIIPKRRSVGVTATVARASAGAVEHMAIARVTNIPSAIDELKESGLWIYGAEADGAAYYDTDMTGAAAIVLGSEGKGISRLVREKCDFVVSIPMYGKVNSFNVSTAAAVLLLEAAKQRHKSQR